jgi:hypothetical protein
MSRLSPLLAAVLAVACSAKGKKPEAQKQDPAYGFPHAVHVDADLACTACHATIETATRLEAGVRHVKLPAKPSQDPICSGCHDTDPAATIPSRAEPFRLSFDHAAHLPLVKDCKACHATPPEPGDRDAKVPPMAVCTSCHNHQKDFAEARCTPCHVDLKGLAPQTAFSHQGDWLRVHGPLAKPTAESCAQCHDQTYCAECHSAQTAAARPSVIFPEEVTRAFIHRGDYVSRHTIEAGANPASCRRCHGSAFCEACHTQQGFVSDRTTFGSPRDPHPAGWVGGEAHGRAARRDVTSCAGCHDNGADALCVNCHQVGGSANVNPHPRAFTRKHSPGDIEKNAMCRACHRG